MLFVFAKILFCGRDRQFPCNYGYLNIVVNFSNSILVSSPGIKVTKMGCRQFSPINSTYCCRQSQDRYIADLIINIAYLTLFSSPNLVSKG